jgi:hypothetical protein
MTATIIKFSKMGNDDGVGIRGNLAEGEEVVVPIAGRLSLRNHCSTMQRTPLFTRDPGCPGSMRDAAWPHPWERVGERERTMTTLTNDLPGHVESGVIR